MSTFYAQYPASSGGSSSNPSVGPNGTAIPTDSTLVAGENPSGNLEPLQTDASGNLLVSLAAEPGAPLHVIVDSSALPTSASTSALQVSGNTQLTTIASNQTNGTQVTAVNSSALPTGASTSANQTNGTQLTGIVAGTANIGHIDGQGTAGTPSGGVVSVQGVSGGTAIPISGTVTLTSTTANQGTANTVANGWPVKITDGTSTAAVKAASTAAVAADPAQVVALSPNNNILANALLIKNTDGTNTAAVKAASTAAAATDPALVVAISPNNTLPVNQTQINGVAVLTGSGTTGTGAQRTVLATHATGTITSVAGSATSVTLLAANTLRSGAMFYNDSTQIVYLALASTASTSSYTVQLPPNGYYELPAAGCYNGIVTGIQSSATGNVRVTEITG